MPDLLDFKPDRDLAFDPDRELTFQPGRALLFDPNRDVQFNPGRDLGFGKRGPVFRGFVCPVCGAAVTADQPSCTECGAVFEPKAVRKESPRAQAPSQEPTRPPKVPSAPPLAAMPPPPPPEARPAPPPPPRTYPQPAKRIDVHPCAYCGARVSTYDQFCWNCGNAMYAGPGR